MACGADAAEVLSLRIDGHPSCVVNPRETRALAVGGNVYVIVGTAAVADCDVSCLDVIERFAGADRYEGLGQAVEYVGRLRAGTAAEDEPEESRGGPTLRNVRRSHCRRFITTTAHLCDRRFRPRTYSRCHELSPDGIDYRTRAASTARLWHNEDGYC